MKKSIYIDDLIFYKNLALIFLWLVGQEMLIVFLVSDDSENIFDENDLEHIKEIFSKNMTDIFSWGKFMNLHTNYQV